MLYFVFAFVPMFLAYSATLIDPAVFNSLIETDSQMVLPNLILHHTPLVAQVFFFGALLSAIMSTASATLLAPSVMFTENILKHFALKHMSDHSAAHAHYCLTRRGGAVVRSNLPILNGGERLQGDAGGRVRAAGFWLVLLNGAPVSLSRAISRITMEKLQLSEIWPPQLVGLLFSVFGMLLGSLLPDKVGKHGAALAHHHPPHYGEH
jgi:hypothetical protein